MGDGRRWGLCRRETKVTLTLSTINRTVGPSSGGARILEQAGPAARPKVVWQGLKLFRLTIIITITLHKGLRRRVGVKISSVFSSLLAIFCMLLSVAVISVKLQRIRCDKNIRTMYVSTAIL